MKRKSIRLSIPGPLGKLAAIVELPVGTVRGWGLFSHCFSCTKDLKAIVKISRSLAQSGFAIVRFDFSGLGQSEGDFSDTTFLDNLNDVRAVYQFVAHENEPPGFLIGHSLGGSAMLAVANEFPQVQAVSVIASPSRTTHLADTLVRLNPDVESVGAGMVNTGTYEYLIRKKTVDVLREYDLAARIRELKKRVLVFHSPADRTLGYEHALHIAESTQGPASVINLESANHLLTDDPRDCEFVGQVLSAWLNRYVVGQGESRGT